MVLSCSGQVRGGFKLFWVVLNCSGVFLDGSGAGSKLFRVVLGDSCGGSGPDVGKLQNAKLYFFLQ